MVPFLNPSEIRILRTNLKNTYWAFTMDSVIGIGMQKSNSGNSLVGELEIEHYKMVLEEWWKYSQRIVEQNYGKEAPHPVKGKSEKYSYCWK